MKKVLARIICCILLCAVAFIPAAEVKPYIFIEPPPQTPKEESPAPFIYQTYKLLENTEKFKIIGRSMPTETGISADWSASGVAFNARCKGEVYATITASDSSLFAVLMDDNVIAEIDIQEGTHTYLLASKVLAGQHSFQLLKQRAYCLDKKPRTCSIDAITMTGQLLAPPKEKSLFIEFIGDSLSAGCGTRYDESLGCYNDLAYALSAFSYLTAQTFNADYSIVSVPGYSTYVPPFHINSIYEWVDVARDPDSLYAPERAADLVVINLNTNDFPYIYSPRQKAVYNASVQKLLDSVYRIHGRGVPIIWMTDMMAPNGLADQWMRELFDELGGPANGLFYISVTTDNNGGANHPTDLAHKIVCNELVAFILDNGLLPRSTVPIDGPIIEMRP